MDLAAAEELRLCHAACRVEGTLAKDGERRTNAEAFQRVLWRHREAIVRLIEDAEALDDLVDQMRLALTPFGRCAQVLAPGHNPILISLPSPADGGHTFVQLRPEHFRRAAAVLERLS